MNETLPLEQVVQAYDRMLNGKARFRVVLTVEPQAGWRAAELVAASARPGRSGRVDPKSAIPAPA